MSPVLLDVMLPRNVAGCASLMGLVGRLEVDVDVIVVEDSPDAKDG